MADSKWWKERVVYQIYPRSFYDSNGDGIGDLRGILEKLDYLKWLGVGAIWLSPIYDSPNADMGYDIRDYEAIMQEFGSMKDFESLLDGLHQQDIKLIMDLVVNHSSDEHNWFVESRKSQDNPYRDFYIWRDGKNGNEPNNWASFFTPSAWSFDDNTKQWYLHLFSEKQPDLNWENPTLREAVYAMINQWLDKGVDGFRMDVISLLAKKKEFPDGSGSTDKHGYVFSPEHFSFQPKLHDYLREMRIKCFEGRDCMCVGETTFVNTANANSVVGDGHELDMLFQFDIMDIDSGVNKWDIKPVNYGHLKEIISLWQNTLDWNTLFLGNHDQPRAVSRFGCVDNELLRVRSAKMLASLTYLLRGTPFLYQGEEIGMTNVVFDREDQFRDVETINYFTEAKKLGQEDAAWLSIRTKGRDNARTPMQWNSKSAAGFTNGIPWIMVNPNYQDINVESAMSDNNSILHFYRKLITLRNCNETLKYGSYQELPYNNSSIISYKRVLGKQAISVICNMSNEHINLDLPISGELILSNINEPDEHFLIPFESKVIKHCSDL